MIKYLQRHFAGSHDELVEFGPVGLVAGAQRAPEPDDLQAGGRVLVVLGVGLQVVNVDVGQAWTEN